MSVKFSVVYNEGQKETHTSACFGVMEYDEWYSSIGHRQLRNTVDDASKLIPENQTFIQYQTDYDTASAWETSETNGDYAKRGKVFLKEFKKLLDDAPFMKGFVTVHPILKAVRVHLKGRHVEEVMMALFIARNLCASNKYAKVYVNLRKQNYRPLFSAIMAHLIVIGNTDFTGNTSYRTNTLGEYNWVNPRNFGKFSLIRLMTAQKDQWFDYRQGLWCEGSLGYRRERGLSSRNVGYFDRYCEDRKLTDVFSLPEDVPMTPNQHRFDGRFLFSDHVNFEMARSTLGGPITDGTYQKIIGDAAAVLKQINVSVTTDVAIEL